MKTAASEAVTVISPERTAARGLLERAKELCRGLSRAFIELGFVMAELKKRDSHMALGFESFDKMIALHLDEARTTCYSAWKTVEKLREIPRQALEAMSRTNAENLARLPESVSRRSEWIKKAQKMKVADFERAVTSHLLGKEHRGKVVTWSKKLDAALVEFLEETLRAAKQLEETTSDEVGIERIFTDWAQTHQSLIETRKFAASQAERKLRRSRRAEPSEE